MSEPTRLFGPLGAKTNPCCADKAIPFSLLPLALLSSRNSVRVTRQCVGEETQSASTFKWWPSFVNRFSTTTLFENQFQLSTNRMRQRKLQLSTFLSLLIIHVCHYQWLPGSELFFVPVKLWHSKRAGKIWTTRHFSTGKPCHRLSEEQKDPQSEWGPLEKLEIFCVLLEFIIKLLIKWSPKGTL